MARRKGEAATSSDGLVGTPERKSRAHSVISIDGSVGSARGKASMPSSEVDMMDGPHIGDHHGHEFFEFEDSDDDESRERAAAKKRGVWTGVGTDESAPIAHDYGRNGQDDGDDSDDMQWDEVRKSLGGGSLNAIREETRQADDDDLEITIAKGQRSDPIKKTLGPSRVDRVIRLVLHMSHTLCLLAATRAQNSLINDRLLQARILSLVPERIISWSFRRRSCFLTGLPADPLQTDDQSGG